MRILVSPTVSRRKSILLELLKDRDLDGIVTLASGKSYVRRIITSFLFHPEPLIQWRTVEAIGQLAVDQARRDLEKVRRQIRNMLWLMNDESGGLCRMAPETIGEILHQVPILIPEYAAQLPSFFVEEPFEAGSRWAVYRAALKKPELFSACREDLVQSLSDRDPLIRGYSLLALCTVDADTGLARAGELSSDSGNVRIYDFESGGMLRMTVGDLARNQSEGRSSG
jgi:hypothetical protein